MDNTTDNGQTLGQKVMYGMIMPFIEPVLELNAAPYYLTDSLGAAKRLGIKSNEDIVNHYMGQYQSQHAKIASSLGVCVAEVLLAVQAMGYVAAIVTGFPEVLWIPATTNCCAAVDKGLSAPDTGSAPSAPPSCPMAGAGTLDSLVR